MFLKRKRMTTRDIISKLAAELDVGINSEVQIVYLLAGIRKLIERDDAKDRYPNLSFHCDWALHSQLDRAAAKAVLLKFDAAHGLLRDKQIELHELPTPLCQEIVRISQMKSFKDELSSFLEAHKLPALTKTRPDGWAYFLRFYCRVIEDIPLVVKDTSANGPKNISQVVVRLDDATQDIGAEALFRVTWTLYDTNGQSGTIFIINSFTR